MAYPRGPRLTVDLADEELYRAIRIAATHRKQPVRQVVIEALRDWLRHQEEAEDLRAYGEAKGDPTRPFTEFLSEIGETP